MLKERKVRGERLVRGDCSMHREKVDQLLCHPYGESTRLETEIG
jgi:hypothetical protein